MTAWLHEMNLGNWGCQWYLQCYRPGSQVHSLLLMSLEVSGEFFLRCCSSSNHLPLSQWETFLKYKAFSSVASHEDCPGQAVLTWAGLREQTAGDAQGFIFPCPLWHEHLCGFIYTFCSRFFWCLFQNKTVNYLAEWPFDKHWTCTCTICINV